VVSGVVDRGETYRGPLLPSAGNDRLLTLLGGDRPDEVLAIPVRVDGHAALVLYGDNGPRPGRIGSARPLEIALAQAGLEMEKDSLEGRLKNLEQARQQFGA
jgi:hypothetical protein